MSDLLTHWAVYDDSRRLAFHDARIEPLFARVMQEQREFARLGALARAGSRWVPAILMQLRGTAEAVSDPRTAMKLAFALGGITHNAADHVLKPLMSRLARADWNATHHAMESGQGGEAAVSIREISAYYDCHVFRQVYAAGREEPFHPAFLVSNREEPGRGLEDFIRSLFQRALLTAHTLSPDMEHFDLWLDNLIDRVQPLYLDIEMYARVYSAPDPRKTAAYGVETEFYLPGDPAVAGAQAARQGQAPAVEMLDAAADPDGNAGGYGKALALSLLRLREASAFWRGELPAPPDLKQ